MKGQFGQSSVWIVTELGSYSRFLAKKKKKKHFTFWLLKIPHIYFAVFLNSISINKYFISLIFYTRFISR